jgi:methanogenic corrinoid protein MtbC1
LRVVEEALRGGHNHADIYVDVFSEALRTVGLLWEQNKISVAQEHMATAISQYAIAMIYPRLVPAAPCRGSMVVTGVSGEQHQIGANLVADAMEAQGWAVRFLGANLPHATILSTIEETAADVLCISTTLVANLPSTAELIRLVQEKLGQKTPRIVLGGAAFRFVPEFAMEKGSPEVICDLRQALATL